jgi:hypothetical protein
MEHAKLANRSMHEFLDGFPGDSLHRNLAVRRRALQIAASRHVSEQDRHHGKIKTIPRDSSLHTIFVGDPSASRTRVPDVRGRLDPRKAITTPI